MKLYRVSVAVGALVVAALALPAWAAPPTGVWSGPVKRGDDAVRLTATFSTDSVKLRFGPELSCEATASFISETNGDALYRVARAKSSGGFCDRLESDKGAATPVHVITKDAGKATITFDSVSPPPKTVSHWSGELTPAASP
jgi:hypothetical protein